MLFNHPFLFAAVAVVAVAVAIFEILSSQKENKSSYDGRGRRSKKSPPPPLSPKREPARSPSPLPSPKQKSVRKRKPARSPKPLSQSKSNETSDSTAGSYSNSLNDNLRKLDPDQPSQKEKSPRLEQTPLSTRSSPSPAGPGSPNTPLSTDSLGSPSESIKIFTDPTIESCSNSPGNDLRNLDLNQSSQKEKYLDDSRKLPSLGQNSLSPELKPTSSFDSSRPSSNECTNEASDDSVEFYSNSSVNNLQELNFDQTSQKENFPNDLKDSTVFTAMTAEEELSKTPFLVNSENISDKNFDEKDYCKYLLDKLSNDTKNILKQNIYNEESCSSEDNLFPENEEKLINETLSSGVELNKNNSNSDINTCEAQNNEHDYKEDNFQSSSFSSQENKLEKISESNLCKSCKEEHINVQAYPCNHSCLCAECAVRIFRIYKKCCLCYEDVVEYVQITT